MNKKQNWSHFYLLIGVFLLTFFSFWIAFLVGIEKSDKLQEKTETIGTIGLEQQIQTLERPIIGEQEKLEIAADSEINLLFFGDLMLDRHNRYLMERKGASWFTQNIESMFSSNDLNILNLEGPITDYASAYAPNQGFDTTLLKFTFDPQKTSQFLEQGNFKLVNLGNNHINNYGKSGIEQTFSNLEKNQVEYFGDIQGYEINGKIKEINGQRFAFVSYNEFGGKPLAETVKEITQLKQQTDFVIVYTHWGQEYSLSENASERQKAYAFVDAGADLIIGSHPHVIQPVEVYKDKAIFYSLGNFVFDQYFSYDTQLGLAVSVRIMSEDQCARQGNSRLENPLLEEPKEQCLKTRWEFVLTPLYMQKTGQLELASEEQRQQLFERMATGIETTETSAVQAETAWDKKENKTRLINEGRLIIGD